MKTKPWFLVILSLLHVLAPLGNLILNAVRFNRSLSQQWHYWFNVLPRYLVFIYIGVPILAGIFIFICRRWSYWAYLGCLFVLFLVNLYAYWTAMNYASLLMLMAVLTIDLLVVAYFVLPSVQKIYLDPHMRWWEAAPRYNFNIDGFVNEEKAFLKNLSQGGLFLFGPNTLNLGDKVQATWAYDGSEYKIDGIVIYKVPGDKAGYGLRFEHSSETRKLIKEIIKKLDAKDLIVKERLPGPEDSFGVWLKKLITTGEGLFPKSKV